MNKNNDGTNRIIEKNFTCLYPTNVPFWKRARDVDFCVRTRSQEARQDAVNYRTSIDIVGIQAAKTLRGGCMQTSLSCIFLL